MSVFGRDLARDGLNRSWDAALAGGVSDAIPSDQDELTLLRRFHTLDDAPGPDTLFVERLGQQLAFVARSHMQTSPQPATVSSAPSSKPRPVPPVRTPSRHRWASLGAVLLLLLAAASGLWLTQRQIQPEERSIPAVTLDATPATPSAEGEGAPPLLHATFDPASIGATSAENWTVALEYQLRLEPGEAYRQNGPASGDSGVSVVVIDRGTFDARSSGLSLVVRKGESAGQEIPSNTSIALAEGDAWIASMSDLATGTNTSGGPATLVRVAIGEPGDGTYFEFSPPGGYPFAHDPSVPVLPAGPVTVNVQLVSLDPGDTHAVEIRADEPYLLVTTGNGAVRVTRDGSNRGASTSATSLGDYPTGAYTISRDLMGTVDFYLARWTSAIDSAPAPTTPVVAGAPRSAVEHEQLADLTFDPALLGADATQSWTMIDEFIVEIEPGETVSIGGELFDGGFYVMFPLIGSVAITTSRDALWSDRIAADSLPIAPGATQAIDPGQAWAGAAAAPIEIANRTDQPAILFLHSLGTTVSRVAGGVGIDPDHMSRMSAEDPNNQLVYAGEPVTVSVERVTVDHAEHYDFALGANESVLLMTADSSPVRFTSHSGQVDTAGYQRALHGSETPQAYTITRDIDGPVDIYLVRVSVPPADETGAIVP